MLHKSKHYQSLLQKRNSFVTILQFGIQLSFGLFASFSLYIIVFIMTQGQLYLVYSGNRIHSERGVVGVFDGQRQG